MSKRYMMDSSNQTPRGIIRSSRGVAITPVGLPMADHFFQATGYRIKQISSNLHLVFGAQTAFPDEADFEYRLAIEIVYPVEMAVRYLKRLNWDAPSSGSNEPFAKVVEKAVSKELDGYSPPKTYRVPAGSNFRSFPSNFSIMSISTGQASIEFFEAPPGMLVEAFHQKSGWRPNSDVRAILTVVLPPMELYRMLVEIRDLLNDVNIPVEDFEEASHV